MSKICFICDVMESPDDNLTKCSQQSFERIIEYAHLWYPLGQYVKLNEKIAKSTWNETIFHHRNCYISLTHKSNLNKFKRSYGRKSVPSTIETQNTYDLTLCIICQIMRKTNPSQVSTTRVAKEILDLKMTSIDLKIRLASLNDTLDVIDKRIKYHPSCLLKEKKKIVFTENSEELSEESIYKKINDDFLTIVKEQLISSGENSPTADVKQLVEQYQQLIDANNLPQPVDTMRRYITNILKSDQELMSQVDFYHHDPCKPTVIANKSFASKLICDKHFNEDESDVDSLMKSAKAIRKELSSTKPWNFNGTFDNFEVPQKLLQLTTSIISDSKSLSEKKKTEVDTISANIAQYIYCNFKSDRQLCYQSDKNRGFEKHRLTPLSVGIALTNYRANKSKSEIESLSNIGLSINYDRLERILTGIAMTLIEVASTNQFGIILPSCFKKGIRPIFAADNIDLGSDASSFHGADLIIVQRSDANGESLFPEIQFETKCEKRSLTSSIAPEIDENVELTTENDSTYITPVSIENPSQYWLHFEQLNLIWLCLSHWKFVTSTPNEISDQEVDYCHQLDHENEWLKNLEKAQVFIASKELQAEEEIEDSTNCDDNFSIGKNTKALSWSAFHSFSTAPPDSLSNVAIVAPLYRRSPTEAPVLLDILKRAMNISVLTVGPEKRAIITLDGGLYVRAVQIKDYKSKWIIRLGSLHTIIAALKCLGKYIEGSGIDASWEVSGMYGSATINQIIEGRHIYRGIQAHTVTLISLHYLHAKSTLKDEEKRVIERLLSDLENNISADENNNGFADALVNAQAELVTNSMFEKLKIKDSSSSPTATFLYNYMAQVMNLLNYIGATRSRKWNQHLATTDEMCKYFHAHDQINYAKWAALYLADMLELQTTDVDSWQFLSEGNFTVSKNEIPFTSIDPDHAIEHEHKPMKMKGGFTGITGNEPALERFALTMPILSSMAENCKRYFNIKPSSHKQHIHHELVGNFFANRLKHAQNLANVLSREGNPFEYSDLRNLVNFAVPRDAICKDVLHRDQLGADCLKTFRDERMAPNSKVPFWSPFTKNNFKMFSDTEIIVNNTKKMVTTLRQEKQLYARMLLISTSRPELCPQKAIGEYEFTNIPLSNFFPDGSMITATDNDKLIKLIKKMPERQSNNLYQLNKHENSVVIINAMYMLDLLKKRKPIKNVSDLALIFVSELQKMSEIYSEIRLIFDPFVLHSLKSPEQRNKSQKVRIHYHVNNATPIKNFDRFLAHIDTRRELATFLGKKALEHFKDTRIKFMTAYGNQFFGNQPIAEICSHLITGEHKLEETNQLILLNAIDIANRNPNRNLYIKTANTNTDIVVVLVGLYNFIPPSTTIISSGESVQIAELYCRLGKKLSDSLIGWYAFHGMDNQGAFNGKRITTQFTTFLKCDDDILHAFSNFGTTSKIPENVIEQMERFVCLLYGNNNERSSIKELRFSMSAIKGKDGSQLPPTLGTLVPHISRSYYQALRIKMSMDPCPNIPPPSNYYWFQNVNSDGTYQPVMCINPPTPSAIVELKKCSCKADTKRCTRLTCTCLKNGLQCCDFCSCGESCENVAKENINWDGSDDFTF